MDTLDDNFTTPNPDEISPRSTGIRYGVILALVTIGLGMFGQILGGDSGMENVGMTSSLGCLTFVIMIVVIVLGVKAHRDQELGGFMTLGRGMAVSFWIGLVYSAIATVWQFFYSRFINPSVQERLDEVMEDSLNQVRVQVEDGEVPEVVLTYTETMLSIATNPLFGFIVAMICVLFFGFFVSLFLKREQPMA